jgi:hypothetical protein
VIDLLLALGADPTHDADFLRAFAEHEESILDWAQRDDDDNDEAQVAAAEAVVRQSPGDAFAFDGEGHAGLTVGGRTWRAGRFEPVALGTLRTRAAARSRGKGARLRLWVVDGDSPATDIGVLQGRANGDTLFQVASQFNCLEATSPRIASVASYVRDPTQGPRASISAFPGTLLRHYCAPGPAGERFVQTNDGRQIELLAEVCAPDLATVRNGYLLAEFIADPGAFHAALESRFDAIRVGVHDDVEAVLGSRRRRRAGRRAPRTSPGKSPGISPRISQVFTSTLAGGGYGGVSGDLIEVCRLLLRAAYLGTLLAAASLGRGRVVLTLIGGGVFGNPPRLIWDAITWALDEAESLRLLPRDLDVVVNGRRLGQHLGSQTLIKATRDRGGVLLACPRDRPASIHR